MSSAYGGSILRTFPLLIVGLALTSPFVHALPTAPSVLAVLDLGSHAIVTWASLGAIGATHYDVYGLQAGEAVYLGFVEAPHAAFLAPGGFDGYRVLAVIEGKARPLGTICVSYQEDPPDVKIDWNCGRAANLLSYHLP